jgi:adenylate kinase family enzyme
MSGSVLKASEVLQEHVIRESDDSRHWKACWSVGKNAPDSEVNPVLWQAYARSARSSGLNILDGYPRTYRQLADFLGRGGRLDKVILLQVSDDLAIARIAERAARSGRVDDEIRVARNRIRSERDAINKLVEHVAVKRCLVVINVERSSTESLCLELTKCLVDKPNSQ